VLKGKKNAAKPIAVKILAMNTPMR